MAGTQREGQGWRIGLLALWRIRRPLSASLRPCVLWGGGCCAARGTGLSPAWGAVPWWLGTSNVEVHAQPVSLCCLKQCHSGSPLRGSWCSAKVCQEPAHQEMGADSDVAAFQQCSFRCKQCLADFMHSSGLRQTCAIYGFCAHRTCGFAATSPLSPAL